MAPPDEIFDISGPVHLPTSFNWRNTFHRRSLAASLVQGVYVLEKDRQSGRTGQDAHAPPWWERFHFQLKKILVTESKPSYFGAIFELKDNAHLFHDYESSPHPPRYIIAFRGTIFSGPTTIDDMKLNIKCRFDKLKDSPRFHTALDAVLNTVANEGVGATNNVWIAGHSLGASIATLAGRYMAKSGCHLETYLFNPPFIRIPMENIIKNESIKTGICVVRSFLKAGVATAIYHRINDPEEDQFSELSAWKPKVFVNQSDPICAAYIRYYKHRETMEGIGARRIEMIATKHSTVSLVTCAVGRELERFHLLPTAYMTENISPCEGLMEAHGIRQWWQPHFQWQSKLHKFE